VNCATFARIVPLIDWDWPEEALWGEAVLSYLCFRQFETLNGKRLVNSRISFEGNWDSAS